jgi:hypothetical protein
MLLITGVLFQFGFLFPSIGEVDLEIYYLDSGLGGGVNSSRYIFSFSKSLIKFDPLKEL